MSDLSGFFSWLDSYIGGSQWFVFLLLGTGLFFTFYLGFPQIRYFRHAIRVVSGRYDESHHAGDTSHFQALATALSGTVGTGNIAGVALAIHLGGPAALFWMLVTAFLGMTTKMVEVTLSHKYRDHMPDGTISGGPMYYMKNRLHMGWLAGLFAVATIFSSFGTGSLPQINSISNSMYAVFGIKHYITGLILSVLLGMIIIGGIRRIVKVTEKLVPFMAIVYVLGAFSVLALNYENIIPSIVSIFSNVFSGTAATGGFLGAGFAWAFNRGVNRGLFSNEAGQGSAPIAHAAAKAEEPVAEGMVAILEPFIDTIIICFLTGLVLLSSGVWNEKIDNRFQRADMTFLAHWYHEENPEEKEKVADFIRATEPLPLFSGDLVIKDGELQDSVTLLHARSFAEHVRVYRDGLPYTGLLSVKNGAIDDGLLSGASPVYFSGRSLLHSAPLSTEAFKRGFLGDLGKYIIPVALLMFAFSTAIAWSYYGGRAVTYLWGTKYVNMYRFVYVLTFFVASFTDTSIVWAFSGITVALMTLPNLFGILVLHKEVKNSIRDYWKKMKNP